MSSMTRRRDEGSRSFVAVSNMSLMSLELVWRADTVTVKSEGTRVLGNIIKTLFADLSSTDPRRKTA